MLHWLITLCLTHASAGEMYAYPAQKIPLRGIGEIKIIGVNGKLNLRGRGRQASLNLRVSHSKNKMYDDWQLQVERRGSVLFLEVFNVAYGKAWDRQVKKEIFPEFDIDIDGASLPVTVAWREGRLSFKDWRAKIDASFLKGQARVEGGVGDLNLQPVEGDLQIEKHQGDLKINGQSGKVELAGGGGAARINWLSGKVRVEKWRGPVTVEAQNSNLFASEVTGALKAKVREGRAEIRAGSGQVDVEGGNCAWDVRAEAPANLNLQSESGPIQLHWKGGGQVFLTSKRGEVEIQHSDFLSVVSQGGARVAEGRKLMSKMGQVFVKTDRGRIRWRQ